MLGVNLSNAILDLGLTIKIDSKKCNSNEEIKFFLLLVLIIVREKALMMRMKSWCNCNRIVGKDGSMSLRFNFLLVPSPNS